MSSSLSLSTVYLTEIISCLGALWQSTLGQMKAACIERSNPPQQLVLGPYLMKENWEFY